MNSLTFVRAIALATLAAALAPIASAQALLSSSSVTVSVTLTAKCRWNTAAPTSLAVDFGTYTAFQTTAQTPTTPQTFVVECTRGFGGSPTVAWDGATNLGTVAGLQYSLSVTGGTPLAGSAATTTGIGSGDQITYTLSGSMPAGQAGATAAVASASRQLTLTF
ncbi:MAG: hypothetical protein JWP22_3868, partial [Ramlibacter sp.]|jgi:hypothetical protein|nr:hypothetical protein [Ramlibacter sp.]